MPTEMTPQEALEVLEPLIDLATPFSKRQEYRAALAVLRAAVEPHTSEGHGQPCYYCGRPTNELAANPSEWPVALCHSDDSGVVKWHHAGCISERLEPMAELEAWLREGHGRCVDSVRYRPMQADWYVVLWGGDWFHGTGPSLSAAVAEALRKARG